MNKNIKFLSLVCLALAIFIIGQWAAGQVPETPRLLGGLSVSTCSMEDPNGTSSPGYVGGNGTTSPKYLSGKMASPTITCLVDRAESAIFTLMATASTSATVIQFEEQYSYNGIDFFTKDTSSTTAYTINHEVPGTIEKWRPTITATTTKAFVLTPSGAKYVRIRIGVDASVSGGAAAVYGEIMKKSSF